MLHFEEIQYLWLWLLLPVLLGGWLWIRWQVKQQRATFGDMLGLERLAPHISKKKHGIKFSLLLISFFFLVIALANPRMGNKTQSVKREGVDVFIALDVSRSMWAEDLKPNRMERARQFAQKLVEELKGDRVGLILFAGQAYMQMPLTVDYAAAEMFVRTASPQLDITQGTAIEGAIDLSVELSNKQEDKKQRALVIITDGENHEQGAVSAANTAKDEGIATFVVVAGTEKGAPIPVKTRRGNQYKLDKSGQIVQSKLNRPLMEKLARAGGGQLYEATQSDRTIARLKNKISKLEKSEFEQQDFDVFETYYQYFVLVALILLFAEFMISYRRSTWLNEEV